MSMSQWTPTTLGELGKYINGRGFKKSEWGQVGRPIIRIQNLTGSSQVFNHYDGEVEDRYIVRPGDLLLSWAATLGAYFWDGPEGLLNQHIFRVESKIDIRFHKYLLDYKLEELSKKTHGSGIVHITRGRFDETPVTLPPLPEQEQIVEILEDHISRLDAGVELLERAALRTDALDDALVTDAPELQVAPQLRLDQVVAEKLTNGRSVPTADEGFPVLRLTAMRGGRIDLAQRKIGAWTAADAEVCRVARGDIFVARGNGSIRLVGRAALVDEEPGPVAFPDTMIRIRPDESQVLPEYLVRIWNSRIVRLQIETIARTTAGIFKVSQKDLNAIVVPVPALPEQKAMVARLRERSGAASRLGAELERGRARADRLRRSLLAAAFSGRLTGASSDLDRVEELAEAMV